jgi:VWFA-related protein
VTIRGALLVAALLLAQQQAPPTFKSRVDLVQVDVVVVDKDGNQVRGLKAADFALADRNTPQTIATFEEISNQRDTIADMFPVTLKRDVASNQGTQADRLVVLVLDDLHIYKGRTERAKQIARNTIQNLGAQGSMAVLFTSGENGTQVTEDRSRLLAAVDTLKGRRALRRPPAAIDSQGVKGFDGQGGGLGNLQAISETQQVSLQDFWDNMSQFKALETAARVLASGSENSRKAFIMVSEGIAKDMTGMFEGGTTPCDARCPSCACYHDNALRAMMNSLWRNSVSTYTIDPRGSLSTRDLAEELSGTPGWDNGSLKGGDSDPFRWSNPVRLSQLGLNIMAEAAGGFGVINTDDFDAGVKRIVADMDHYYLLGFYPAETNGKDLRPVQVRVPAHPEWTLRFRKGYVPGAVATPPKNKSALVNLSSGVLPKDDLPLRLTAITLPGAKDLSNVVIALEVTAPVKALQEADGHLRDTLTYQILVVDEKKNKVKSMGGLKGRLAMSPRDASLVAPDTVMYQVGENIELAAGRYQLRVSATSEKLTEGGSVYLNIDVPDRKEGLIVSGLAVGYSDDRRVLVAPVRPGVPSSRGKSTPPAGLPLTPSVNRVFSPADTLRLYFEVTSKTSEVPRALIEVLNSDNHAVHSASPELSLNDRWQVDMPLPLDGLAPGPYIIRVTAIGSGQTIRRETGILVK